MLLQAFCVILCAQSYTLQTGKVYVYNETEKKWSDNPLCKHAIINENDSIKSDEEFTITLPYSIRNAFLKNRSYTIQPCENGVRLNKELIKNKRFVFTANTIPQLKITTMGSIDTLKAQHLLWLFYNEKNSHDEEIGLQANLISGKDLSLINDSDTISSLDSMAIEIINMYSSSVCVYILWKDKSGWSMPFEVMNDGIKEVLNDGLRAPGFELHKYSVFTTQFVGFSEPFDDQDIFVIYSPNEIETEVFNILMNNNLQPVKEEKSLIQAIHKHITIESHEK